MTATILVGDCRDVLPTLDAESFDAVVTDPPYALGTQKRFSEGTAARTPIGKRLARGFMGQTWDNAVAFDPDTWRAVLRVMRPASWLVAFGGSRTWHRLACAIEDAGFETTDSLAWLHGQGFPKGASCLKPAFEPIVLARSSSRGAVLQIDAARIDGPVPKPGNVNPTTLSGANGIYGTDKRASRQAEWEPASGGRWPANVVLDAEAAAMLDEQAGERESGSRAAGVRKGMGYHGANGDGGPPIDASSGSASRFFYTAKADTAERGHGLASRNGHPTVKPIDLMSWLVRLVTPPAGRILDPFLGSGTTAIAAIGCGFSCVGVEQSAEYAEIARQRIGLFGEVAS